VGSTLVSPSANLITRVRDHTSTSSGAGPMELVSMACPSVVRGRIIIIVVVGIQCTVLGINIGSTNDDA
jgi:hypothetical protein